jgi:HEPN domain-containing protein
LSDAARASKWLDFARDDLWVAQRLFHEFHPKQVYISCYHCQQAVEKALKAFLVNNDADFPFTHDCAKLCRLCKDLDGDFDNFLEDCGEVTPYATQSRYPNNAEIEEWENESALKIAERIVSVCEEKNGAAQ